MLVDRKFPDVGGVEDNSGTTKGAGDEDKCLGECDRFEDTGTRFLRFRPTSEVDTTAAFCSGISHGLLLKLLTLSETVPVL